MVAEVDTLAMAYNGISSSRGAGSRRQSAASVSGALCVPSGAGAMCTLSPNSAYPAGFNPQRRRNSYAAGQVPELYIDDYGGMTPTLAAQHNGAHMTHHHHQYHQQQYGSQHLLDPSAAYHRRRLPPTPLDLANGRLSGSHEMLPPETMVPAKSPGLDGIIRRSSSPRVLPTPPPQQMHQYSPVQWGQNGAGGVVTAASPSPTGWTSVGPSPPPATGPFERRPSSRRRRLPTEPVHAKPAQTPAVPSVASIDGSLPPMNAREQRLVGLLSVTNGGGSGTMLGLNGGTEKDMTPLQRSSSTRSARGQNGRSAQLPPAPRQQQSLETNNDLLPVLPPPTALSSSVANSTKLSRTCSTTTAAASKQRINVPNAEALAQSVVERAKANNLGVTTGDAATTTTQTQLSASLTPPPQKQSTVSAPTTPREVQQQQHQQAQLLHQQQQPPPVRKYSSDSPSVMNDMVAIAALNLHRNGSGSMAHLLEQQHILRREFTTTPSSEATTTGGGGGGGHSNASSLSPSIEQLNNCNVSASRSGSDAEIVADPSILGFDPALYTSSNGHCCSVSVGGSFSGPSGSPSFQLPAEPSTSAEEQHPRPRGLGLIHCTLQHFPVRKRLRVNVLKIEGLAGELRPELEIQPFCKLTLTPGKKQQQQSVVKRGRDAVFNQEFFFDGVATEEIDSKQLQIEVCHSSAQKLQKDLEIGEVRIPLRDLTQQLHSKKEVRIVEELKLFAASKKLGKLHISTCIEKEARRLTINLHKAEDLPKWGIIGAPDVQIRIRMQQGQGPEVTKSSRVLKNTTTAVYKEAVMFLISTREADLIRTRITISIHDLSRSVTGNDVIGSVFLGELAVDKSEQDQWRNTVDHWGKEYKGVHALKGPQGQGAPEVHVLDVQEDEHSGGNTNE